MRDSTAMQPNDSVGTPGENTGPAMQLGCEACGQVPGHPDGQPCDWRLGDGSGGGEKADFCTFCRKRVILPHYCGHVDSPMKKPDVAPNRFDPFEALDEIVETAGVIASDPIYFTKILQTQVERLRAYITGTEK